MRAEGYVRCRVRPGLFSGEFVVTLDTVGARGLEPREFVADGRGVEISGEPRRDAPAEGKLRVYVLGRENGIERILVPASPASGAEFVRVPAEMIAS
jgi:hypothetical protein